MDLIGGISGLTVPCLRKTHKMTIDVLDYFFYSELIQICAIQLSSDVINVADISLVI